MQSFWRFLSQNNAVPIAFSLLLLGAGGAFAATDPGALYSTSNKIVSVDNTYIANKDLTNYTPKILIDAVTEDGDNYYVAYTFSTIDVQDYVWRDAIKEDTLTVPKLVLGNHTDLGVYVTDQFRQLVGHEKERLQETQDNARKQVSQKVVATSYGGLVGKFLDDTTQTLPGYTPVVIPVESQTAAVATVPDAPSAQSSSASGGSSQPPVIQIIGPNPQQIPLNANFADLGVVVSDDSGYIPTVVKSVDGVVVHSELVTVDTSKVSEHHIQYVATDNEGNTTTAVRVVDVVNPFANPAPSSTDTASTSRPVAPQATTSTP